MRWPWTRSVESDRLLLKRCNNGDLEAQREFAAHSYRNEVLLAVRNELLGDYEPSKTDLIAIVCIGRIYKSWEALPIPLVSLRWRIRRAAIAFACKWRERDATR